MKHDLSRTVAYCITAMMLGLCWYACLAVFPFTSAYFWSNGEYTVDNAIVPFVSVVASWVAFALLFKREIERRSVGLLVMFGGASGFVLEVLHAWAYAALSLAAGQWQGSSAGDYWMAVIVSPFLGLSIAAVAAPIVIPLGIGSVFVLRLVLRWRRAVGATSVRTAGAS